MKKTRKRAKVSESKSTSKTGLSGIVEKYKSLETKQNPAHTGIKSLTEIAAGVGAGSVVSAAVGKNSPLLGVLMVIAGNYLGDPTNLLKTVGIGTIAHGIAKANDYDSMSDPKERLQQLKSDWKKTLRLSSSKTKTTNTVDTSETEKIKIKVVDEPIANFDTEKVPNDSEVDGVNNEINPDYEFSFWDDELKSELDDLNIGMQGVVNYEADFKEEEEDPNDLDKMMENNHLL